MIDWLIAISISILSWFGLVENIENTPLAPPLASGEVVRVIDGDTIDVRLGEEIKRIRYIGIDSPEIYINAKPECFSREALEANEALVAGKIVELESDVEDKDKYDRLLRYVYVDGEFVNKTLIEQGYADLLMIPPNTREYDSFAKLRDRARLDGSGLWGECGF